MKATNPNWLGNIPRVSLNKRGNKPLPRVPSTGVTEFQFSVYRLKSVSLWTKDYVSEMPLCHDCWLEDTGIALDGLKVTFLEMNLAKPFLQELLLPT